MGELTLDLQLDALTKTVCRKVCTETASGAKADRPVLAEVLDYLYPGDTFVAWRLDCSLTHLIETLTDQAAASEGRTPEPGTPAAYPPRRVTGLQACPSRVRLYR